MQNIMDVGIVSQRLQRSEPTSRAGNGKAGQNRFGKAEEPGRYFRWFAIGGTESHVGKSEGNCQPDLDSVEDDDGSIRAYQDVVTEEVGCSLLVRFHGGH